MTAERACFHKLMLSVGLTESFDRELDTLLEQEDPLSDLVLALSTCGGDRNEQIHILCEYLLNTPPEQIDSDAVFSLVAGDFLALYEKDPNNLERILGLMHSVSDLSGFAENDPWFSMWELLWIYDEIEPGSNAEALLRESLVELLRDGTSIFPPQPQPRQEKQTLIEKWKSFFYWRRR